MSLQALGLAAAALCVSMTAGCASLRAPVEFSATQQAPRAERALRLEAVEGRPNGLLLRFRCACEVPEDGWVEVLERHADALPQAIRSVRMSEALRAQLGGDGVEFFDRSVEAQTPTAYQIRLRTSEDDAPARLLEASNVLVVDWQEPPPKPEKMQAASRLPGAVELRWQAPKNAGALVFRRDVLEEGARTERLAQLGAGAQGTFVDRDVTDGGVYAYRVALAVDTGAMLQYGHPSEEIYVTVRPAP